MLVLSKLLLKYIALFFPYFAQSVQLKYILINELEIIPPKPRAVDDSKRNLVKMPGRKEKQLFIKEQSFLQH